MTQYGEMNFYHRTSAEEALAILKQGFSDNSGYLLGARIWRGVWLSRSPFKRRSDKSGNTLLKVTVNLSKHELGCWEWTGENQPVREWLIPAAVINQRMTAMMVSGLA